MVKDRKLLIALAPVVLIGLVARFGLVQVETTEGIYYETLPSETPSYKALTVYVCPKCRAEIFETYREFRSGESAVAQPEGLQLFYVEPTEDGFCKHHPDTKLEATEEIPTGPQVALSLPEDTEYITRFYFPKDPQEGGGQRPINVTVVISAKDRRSIHRAESCLAAQGWVPLRPPRFQMLLGKELPDGKFSVRSLLMFRDTKDEAGRKTRWEEPVFYWYAALPDRRTASEYKRLALTFYDRLIRGLNFRWSYVLVSKVVPPAESSSAAAKELEQFIIELVSQIESGTSAGTATAGTGEGSAGEAAGGESGGAPQAP